MNDMFGNEVKAKAPNILGDKFGAPPFSALDAKQGWWSDRKRAWKQWGIKSDESREDIAVYDVKGYESLPTVSVFDPVLTELMYSWFCPAGGKILDPFAGGSVRGVIAAEIGFRYWGCDLRPEQVYANNNQKKELLSIEKQQRIEWVCGDSVTEVKHAPLCDMAFTCPPYGDLEVYSEDVKDLSTMPFDEFMGSFGVILEETYKRLKDDSFAVIVVGDYRDKKTGILRAFPAVTIALAQAAGFGLYNSVILLTPTGSAAMRASAQFSRGRKVVMVHQRVLVFIKGNPKKAEAKILLK